MAEHTAGTHQKTLEYSGLLQGFDPQKTPCAKFVCVQNTEERRENSNETGGTGTMEQNAFEGTETNGNGGLSETAVSSRRFTPQSLAGLQLNLWRAATTTHQSCFGRVEVEGKYVRNIQSKEYITGYYDMLEDLSSSGSNGNGKPVQLTIAVPGKIREQLEDGKNYVLTGIMDAILESGGRWKPVLKVDFLAGRIASTEKSLEEDAIYARKRELLERKMSREQRDIRKIIGDAVFTGRELKVLVFYGLTGIVKDDVDVGMSNIGKLHQVTVREERINMSKQEAVVDAIRSIPDDIDIAAFVRGGGAGVDVYDSLDIAEAVLDSNKCIVSAIGHGQDHPFIENVADRSYATPTEFGSSMFQMVQLALEDIEGTKAKLIEEIRKPYEEELARIKKSSLEEVSVLKKSRDEETLSLKKELEALRQASAEAIKTSAEAGAKVRLELEAQYTAKNENAAKETELRLKEKDMEIQKTLTACSEMQKQAEAYRNDMEKLEIALKNTKRSIPPVCWVVFAAMGGLILYLLAR